MCKFVPYFQKATFQLSVQNASSYVQFVFEFLVLYYIFQVIVKVQIKHLKAL